ncbi:MAG: glycosyltransferase family 9 protein [Dysgonamonadaceae bacterium]|jgi:heptosyltransferase-2|nr:glycosyltransferase family 9 protein [Dysgonamonadaceae bacterium]
MQKIERILILRFRRVGDAVLSSTLCSSLRRTFPNAEIDYVLNTGIAPLFYQHPDIDRILSFSEEEMDNFLIYLRKVYKIMRQNRYDIIVDTRSTLKTLWFSLFSLGTPYRLGKKKWYNFIHNYRSDTKLDDDVVGCTLNLLSPLERKFKLVYDRNFAIYFTKKEKEIFRKRMQTAGIRFSKPVIVCAVATRLSYKMWSKERMAELLLRLLHRFDVQLVFNYAGEEEEAIAEEIRREMKNHPAVFTNIKAHDLRELSAMLSNSNFFFGNEGGSRHISQALNIPSFAIFPPKISKKTWLPNACDRYQGIEPGEISEKANDETLSYTEKFELITVDEVWKRLRPMLNKYLLGK